MTTPDPLAAALGRHPSGRELPPADQSWLRTEPIGSARRRPILATAPARHATEPGMPGRTVPDPRHLEPAAATPWAAMFWAGLAGALGGALVSSAWWLW